MPSCCTTKPNRCCWPSTSARVRCGLAWMSVTQGVVYLAECAADELSAWLARTTPSELLYSAGSTERFEQLLLDLRHNATLACPFEPPARLAV